MSWIKDLLIFTVLITTFFFFALGNRPLSSPDEARYSEIPREMLTSGDLITPHLNGIKYFEKPPLLYWVQAFSFKTFGLNEWSARTPTALFALMGCLITYALGRLLYSRQIGIYAGIILATSLLYFAMAHVLTLDMALTFMLTACMSCLLATLNLPLHAKIRRFLCYGFYAFAALAVLTKGLVGIIFPGAILFFWLLILNRWKELKNLAIPSGIILFLLITVPWHYVVQVRNPEFFDFYILEQQFLRFFTMSAGRYQPAWFFFAVLFAGLFPWVIFLVQSLYCSVLAAVKNRQAQSNQIFLFLWFIIIFSFFSLSKSKLIPYILPVFPPLAIMIAHYIQFSKSKKTSLWILSGIILVLLGALFFTSGKYLTSSQTQYSFLIIFGFTLGIGGIINAVLIYRNSKNFFWGLASWALIFNLMLMVFSNHIEATSVKPLLVKLKPQLQKNDLIVSYGHYYQDMPVYLNQLITIVNWQNELTFGMNHQNTDGLIMSESELWKAWDSKKRIYVMMNQRNYQKLSQQYSLHVISRLEDDVLVTNHAY